MSSESSVLPTETLVFAPCEEVALVFENKWISTELEPDDEGLEGDNSSDSDDEYANSESDSEQWVGPVVLPTKQPKEEHKRIRMVVSASHLSLASPVFRAMLQPGFKEGNALEEHGHVEIHLPDDDQNAFKTAMDILHEKTISTPWELETEPFLKLAIVTDKYALHESIEAMSWHWATKFCWIIFSGTPEDQIALIMSNWIFKETYVFAAVTSRYLSRFHFFIQEEWFEGLPMPLEVIMSLKEIQRYTINRAYGSMENMIFSLRCENPRETVPSQQTCLYELVLLKKILDNACRLQLQAVPKSYASSQGHPRYMGSYNHQKIMEEMRILRKRFGKLAWSNGKRLCDDDQVFPDYEYLHRLNYGKINDAVEELGGMAAAYEWSYRQRL